MPGCKFKIGLLNLRDCKKRVSAHCRSCNRPICSKHARTYKDKRVLCLECYSYKAPANEQDEEYLSSVRQRQDVFESSGFHGFYLGHTHVRYGRDDYESFETDADEFEAYDDAAFSSEDDISQADFQDS